MARHRRTRVPGSSTPGPSTPGPSTAAILRSRVAVAAVAAGALAAAGPSVAAAGVATPSSDVATDALARPAATTATSSTTVTPAAPGTTAAPDPTPATRTATADAVTTRAATASTTTTTTTTTSAATTGVLPVVPTGGTSTATRTASPEAGQVGSLSKSRRLAEATAARAAAARAPQFVKPAEGRFTSGFGARWGTSHNGVDIANAIGTPIRAAGSGTVVEAGPASGFGLWVRVQLDDGTITVYGHVNRFLVTAGQKVRAGQEIAEIGNRGQSTGPHLHFEVWTPSGRKIDPRPWLAERGISLGSAEGGGSD